MSHRIYTAPNDFPSGPVLGRTLPSLLDEALNNYPNATAFNQYTGTGWEAWSTDAFYTAAEETALGLTSLDLARGDRVAFFMHSDIYFQMADMACLMAGLVDVPIYLTNPPDMIAYVLEHAEAHALFVSDEALLEQIAPLLTATHTIHTVLLIEGSGTATSLPEHIALLTWDDLKKKGRSIRNRNPGRIVELKAEVKPDDLATLIYTSGTTGRPKGVMLTHENISYNGLTAFGGITDLGHGDAERVLSFLPMTHVFARTLNYASMSYGQSIYYTEVEHLAEHFQEVKPTLFATVPRVLEKTYDKIQFKGQSLTGAKKTLFDWSMNLASKYEMGKKPGPLYAMQLKLARKLVFSKWHAALGGQVKYIIAGGAALNGDLANQFAAAGLNILQGYGLTETSPVITYNQPTANRAGTVGRPMPGVEVKIAEDGEIVTRGPHVMQGYYKNPEATAEAIDADGWFHTGDIGEFTPEGFLKITDRKKSMFKLSTGKYVVPAPIESELVNQTLIEQAMVVGIGYKFCTALLFPNMDVLRLTLKKKGLNADRSPEELCADPEVHELYQALVDKANAKVSHWESIKRFTLVPRLLTIEDGLLTPTLKVKRSKVSKAYADMIAAMYD